MIEWPISGTIEHRYNEELFMLLRTLICVLMLTGPVFAEEPTCTFRAETKEEAFHFIMCLTRKLAWYAENKYRIALPEHPSLKELFATGGKVSSDEEAHYREIFYREVYHSDAYQEPLQSVAVEKQLIDTVFMKLKQLQQNWRFRVMSDYVVQVGVTIATVTQVI